MYIQNILFCSDCGFIADPDTAIPNKCPLCKHTLSVASDETAGVINLIRMRTPKFK